MCILREKAIRFSKRVLRPQPLTTLREEGQVLPRSHIKAFPSRQSPITLTNELSLILPPKYLLKYSREGSDHNHLWAKSLMGTHYVTKEYLEQERKGRMYRTGVQPETCHHSWFHLRVSQALKNTFSSNKCWVWCGFNETTKNIVFKSWILQFSSHLDIHLKPQHTAEWSEEVLLGEGGGTHAGQKTYRKETKYDLRQ